MKPNWTAAEQILRQADPVMDRLIREYGPCLIGAEKAHSLAVAG